MWFSGLMVAIHEMQDVMSPPVATSPVARHITVEEAGVVDLRLTTMKQSSGEGMVYQSVVYYLR